EKHNIRLNNFAIFFYYKQSSTVNRTEC
ncbi:hypothetical protein, partial [uncultured Gammaproteobacteria bacterium]